MTQLNIEIFRNLFFDLTRDWTWQIEGFLATDGSVHPVDTDTKVISTVFERMASPVIRGIALQFDYAVETANQTTYPDFTLTNNSNKHRIAVDVKTTYVRPVMGFTLGGYNSFLRNDTKNIKYPYSSYAEHWIVGFIYKQNAPFLEYDLETLPKKGDIGCPYDVETVFIREKHEISGLRAGSGNTKNMGSIKLTDPKQFETYSGPFSEFTESKSACDLYWANYEHYKERVATPSDLHCHPDFRKFK